MDLYLRPANRFVAGFIGSPQMNFLPAALRFVEGGVAVDLAGQSLGLPLPPGTGADLSRVTEAGLRPEHLRIVAADQPGLAAQVISVERLGAETLVFAKTTAGQALVVRTDGASKVEDAEAVTLAIDPGHLHFFDRDGVRVEFDLPTAG